MAHNKIIDSVKKHGQVAIKDLDEFLRFVIKIDRENPRF